MAGVVDFEGRRCYWLHGITHWRKDNNQFYDVETGLLAGYRYQSDSSTSAAVTTGVVSGLQKLRWAIGGDEDHLAHRRQDVSYGPLEDSIFEWPEAVKALQQ
jgi:hypothetical protein